MRPASASSHWPAPGAQPTQNVATQAHASAHRIVPSTDGACDARERRVKLALEESPLKHDDRTATTRRPRKPEETRKRILEAAEEEFARKGFDGTRMRDVAQTAGVNHALLHHYFGDKQSLFRAVIEHAFSTVSVQAFEEMRKHGDLESLIPAYVGMLVEFHRTRPSLARLLHLASMDPDSPANQALAEVTRYVGSPVQETIANALREGQTRGKVRSDLEPRRIVALIMGATSYVYLEDRFFEQFLGADVRDEIASRDHVTAVVAFVKHAIFVDAKSR